MQCPFNMCPFRTGRLLGLRYCCLQLSRETPIQTTSHMTLHFCRSSAIHTLSVKLIGWTVVEIIEGQTDGQTNRQAETPSILVRWQHKQQKPVRNCDWLLYAFWHKHFDGPPKRFICSDNKMQSSRSTWSGRQQSARSGQACELFYWDKALG